MPPRQVPYRGARVAASLRSSRTRGSLWTPTMDGMEVRNGLRDNRVDGRDGSPVRYPR